MVSTFSAWTSRKSPRCDPLASKISSLGPRRTDCGDIGHLRTLPPRRVIHPPVVVLAGLAMRACLLGGKFPGRHARWDEPIAVRTSDNAIPARRGNSSARGHVKQVHGRFGLRNETADQPRQFAVGSGRCRPIGLVDRVSHAVRPERSAQGDSHAQQQHPPPDPTRRPRRPRGPLRHPRVTEPLPSGGPALPPRQTIVSAVPARVRSVGVSPAKIPQVHTGSPGRALDWTADRVHRPGHLSGDGAHARYSTTPPVAIPARLLKAYSFSMRRYRSGSRVRSLRQRPFGYVAEGPGRWIIEVRGA